MLLAYVDWKIHSHLVKMSTFSYKSLFSAPNFIFMCWNPHPLGAIVFMKFFIKQSLMWRYEKNNFCRSTTDICYAFYMVC